MQFGGLPFCRMVFAGLAADLLSLFLFLAVVDMVMFLHEKVICAQIQKNECTAWISTKE